MKKLLLLSLVFSLGSNNLFSWDPSTKCPVNAGKSYHQDYSMFKDNNIVGQIILSQEDMFWGPYDVYEYEGRKYFLLGNVKHEYSVETNKAFNLETKEEVLDDINFVPRIATYNQNASQPRGPVSSHNYYLKYPNQQPHSSTSTSFGGAGPVYNPESDTWYNPGGANNPSIDRFPSHRWDQGARSSRILH